MVRSRAQERRRWDTNLLNAMVWDPWNPTPVTRGRPLRTRSDREPILMGPLPKAHVTSPNNPDTISTQEIMPGTTTTYSAERTRVRLSEAEAATKAKGENNIIS